MVFRLTRRTAIGGNLWCTPDDHPRGWEEIRLIAGTFAKPCRFVGTVTWGWEGERIAFLSLETDAYDLADQRPEQYGRTTSNSRAYIHDRPDDLLWRNGRCAGCSSWVAFPTALQAAV